jgi:hypothetical protein
VIRKQGDWFSAKVGDEMAMMSAKMGNFIGLSEVVARIRELRGPRRGRGISQPTGDAWCGCA